ncbi:MAG: hypothetical protein E6J40_06650 [Chloroflexi bacterium]|nr:MAG: hypothetical protein E6J40_06650 [Chloroflexota bacterium]
MAYAAALRRELVRRVERRRVDRDFDAVADERTGSSLARSSRPATRATVLKDPLKIFRARLATSPTGSWRRA